MATSSHLLHHLFRSPSSLLLLKPLCITPSTLCPHKPLLTLFSSRSSPLRPRFFCNFSPSSASSVAFPQTPSPHLLHENDSDFDSKDELAEEEQNEKVELEETLNGESEAKLPTLSVKEKKELSSYAHSLGKKLKCQQVGKSGVTSSVAASFVENLESNELLKIKVHNSCPGELADVVKQLEKATGSVAVGQIGRTVILYRPSITKLKAEEKKRQTRRVFVRKELRLKPTLPKKGEVLRLSGRGHRGRSRAHADSLGDFNFEVQRGN